MMSDNRYLALLCAILTVTIAGCGAQFQRRPETDAELTCRQNGFRRGSTAYTDCVELLEKRGEGYISEE
jgi:hypothetical protein